MTEIGDQVANVNAAMAYFREQYERTGQVVSGTTYAAGGVIKGPVEPFTPHCPEQAAGRAALIVHRPA